MPWPRLRPSRRIRAFSASTLRLPPHAAGARLRPETRPPQDAQHQPGVVGGDPVDLPGDAAPERLLVVDGPDEEAEPRGVSAVDVPGGDVAAVDAQRVGPGSLRRV